MALFIFTKLILENKPIPIFNNECTKETSHIDDLVDAVIKIHENPPKRMTCMIILLKIQVKAQLHIG